MSVYVNKFEVICYGDVTRILFEDCIQGKEGVIQANMVMRAADAELLAKCITDTTELHRQQSTGTNKQ